jgi:hypothetical protein
LVGDPQPTFPRCPGENPRVFSAFLAFFQLGHSEDVLKADLDEPGIGGDDAADTLRYWSPPRSGKSTSSNSGLSDEISQKGHFGCSRVLAGAFWWSPVVPNNLKLVRAPWSRKERNKNLT